MLSDQDKRRITEEEQIRFGVGHDERRRAEWRETMQTHHQVLGNIGGFAVTALAVIAALAGRNNARFGGLEQLIVIAIAMLLGLYVRWFLETVENDREAAFITWTRGEGDPERVHKSERNNTIYKPLRWSLVAAWVLILVLIVLLTTDRQLMHFLDY